MQKFSTQLLGNSISTVNQVKNLGVTFDSGNTFSSHITKVCCACYPHLKDLRRIQKLLSIKTVALLANSMISSRIDYCNFLFYGANKYNVTKLQKIQNVLFRMIFKLDRTIHVTPHSIFKNYTGSPFHTTSCLYIISLHSSSLNSLNLHTYHP